jgi:ribosome-binding protein aMBF1 (putative translation factor)
MSYKSKNREKFVPFDAMKRKAMRDSEFRQAYEAHQPKHDLIRAILDARIRRGMTQTELARRVGTTQSVIARFESGNGNPTLDFLTKISAAVGMRLEIRSPL